MVIHIENPFILVDGHSYLYRAYYAFPALFNGIEEPTWVIYGVLNMLRSLYIKYKPSHMIVIFDAVGKTFRRELFIHYKINRKKMPQYFYNQIKPLNDMIQAMGISLISIPNVEADDIIGTLALIAESNGRKVLISTGDKDMAQLVSSNITLINTMSNVMLDSKGVEDKFGVPPKLIIDYLALLGDKSDNIPGVKGIGKKIAKILLQTFGGLEEIYKNLKNINTLKFRGSKSVAINLQLNKDMAFLAHQLVTIKTDIALHDFFDQCSRVQDPNIKVLRSLFKRYEFKRWLNELESGNWLH